MRFSSPYAVAALTAPPVTASAWSMGYDSLLPSFMMDSPAARLLFDESPFGVSVARPRSGFLQRYRSLAHEMDQEINQQLGLVRQMQQQMDRAFAPLYKSSQSPHYQLVDDDKTFRLTVDVPGMNTDDINVSLDNNVLKVSGHHESSSEDGSRRTMSRFSQSFTLDSAVETDKLTAEVRDGTLVVSAPKDVRRIEANVRKIPITVNSSNMLASSATANAATDSVKDESKNGASVVDAAIEEPAKKTDTEKASDANEESKETADLDKTHKDNHDIENA